MKKLNILIVAYFFPPKMVVGGIRPMSWAKYWSEQGHNVTVVTSVERDKFIKTSPIQAQIPIGIKLIEVRNPIVNKYSKRDTSNQNSTNNNETVSGNSNFLFYIKKLLNLMKKNIPVVDYFFDWVFFSKRAIKKYIKDNGNFDVVVSTSSPLASNQIALWVKKKYKSKWVADFRDIEGQENIKNKPKNSGRGLLRDFVINHNLYKFYKQADILTTVSEGLVEILNTQYPNNKTKIIYNGYFHENYINNDNTPKAWQITYTGTYNDNDFDIKPLAEALKLLSEEDIPIPEINFIGTMSEKFLSDMGNVPNLKIKQSSNLLIEEVAREQMNSAFLLFMDGKYSKGVLATKSFEYIAAKRPIIALISPESEMAIKIMNGSNYYCVGYDAQKIYAHLKYWYKKYKSKDYETENNSLIDIYFYSRKNQALELLKLFDNK